MIVGSHFRSLDLGLERAGMKVGWSIKFIHLETIFDRLQNFKDIIRMGTGFSHNLERLSSYAKWRICRFNCGSSLLLVCAVGRAELLM